jgi:hypothetical protein
MMRAHFLQRAKDGLIELLDALLALAAKPLLKPSEILDAFPDVFSFTHASDCSSAAGGRLAPQAVIHRMTRWPAVIECQPWRYPFLTPSSR